MNKRIEELAKQAFDTIVPDDKEWFKTYSTKLTELIVRDCMSCCDVIAKVEWPAPPTYELGVDACKLKIKQHFGVKND